MCVSRASVPFSLGKVRPRERQQGDCGWSRPAPGVWAWQRESAQELCVRRNPREISVFEIKVCSLPPLRRLKECLPVLSPSLTAPHFPSCLCSAASGQKLVHPVLWGERAHSRFWKRLLGHLGGAPRRTVLGNPRLPAPEALMACGFFLRSPGCGSCSRPLEAKDSDHEKRK